MGLRHSTFIHAMSFFQNLFSPHGPKDRDAGETGPVQMTLNERMAFRREMLFDSVKTTMEGRGIPGVSYKVKVVRADKRGHSFVVMVDLSKGFMDSEQGRQRSLAALGATIEKNAMARYGLGVAAVYWRVSEEFRDLDPQHAAAGGTDDGLSEATRSSSMRRYERATAQELAAFEAAWQNSSEMTDSDIGDSSDIAPLTGSRGKDGSAS